jgi:hypothetical protein
MRHILALAGSAALVVALSAAPATAKSVGGCPATGGWTLASLADLGISPETADGIASLDGNGDGYTCIKPLAQTGTDVVIFRDNTVAAGR